jgi:hypothetical protein
MSIGINNQFTPIDPEIEGPGPDAPTEPDVTPPSPLQDALDKLAGNVGQAIQTALDRLQTAHVQPQPTHAGGDGCEGTAQKEPPQGQVINPNVDINVFI